MSEGSAECTEVIPTLAVGDVDAAIAWYRDVVGFSEGWTWGEPPTHAGMSFGRVEVHFSSVAPDPGVNWLYFVVPDVDALYERLRAAGADVAHPPETQPWEMREIAVRDLVGNHLTFAQPAIAREPKLAIRREEVAVRLETRIVGVLRALAAHKEMDLTELLEETLLHTFEAMPHGGVASPHTQADLERIQTLKSEQGIDYDVHASYRFVEEDEAAEE
ncbi:MAG: VOC family protein [Gemmatimonadota bacterium]